MLRFGFTFILLIHGVMHLLGFVKVFHIALYQPPNVNSLLSGTAFSFKTVGILWLLAATFFMLAAVLFVIKKDWWWIPGTLAVIVSQILIFMYWPEAKFGTIGNIIAAIALAVGFGTWHFNKMVRHELISYQNLPATPPLVVTPEMVKILPPVVQKWLHQTQCIGKELTYAVHLQQRGEMKINPESKWMPFTAEQYFTVNTPSFLWQTKVQPSAWLHLLGRDKYINGRGHMLIKLLSLVPVANSSGKETDQGSLLRYLAEIIWFPSAALQPYITWETIDATSARATMRYGGITANGVFKFNLAGDVVSFTARRYYSRPEGATLEDWLVTVDENSYQEFDGIRIPTQATLTWKLKNSDFTWFRVKITDIAYNGTNKIYGNATPHIAPKVNTHAIK